MPGELVNEMKFEIDHRTTRCLWSGCGAVLNSWALLEKHVHHCHLHPNRLSSPLLALAARSRVHCQWAMCTQMFDSPNDCYQHVLVGHMGAYSARCPFSEWSDCLTNSTDDRLPVRRCQISRSHGAYRAPSSERNAGRLRPGPDTSSTVVHPARRGAAPPASPGQPLASQGQGVITVPLR